MNLLAKILKTLALVLLFYLGFALKLHGLNQIILAIVIIMIIFLPIPSKRSSDAY
ncbi:hypothetical protein [Lapidilactobacillus dextrinicus]|uniref:hypothetical protein n=1 Tax=Lapidilactobacillus dextrinicus TaxID=51664 RepID=UPI0022E7B0A9|nr:hypothetical protein [Lapidilactobacillus dextrinicus]